LPEKDRYFLKAFARKKEKNWLWRDPPGKTIEKGNVRVLPEYQAARIRMPAYKIIAK